ncbi:hypothetical protein H920_05636 [Fukomys damarensis]|uniref:Uncharacterized protein n=1 Tax=Fukomys damarensis TaxID=885580 RepID=A0A091DRX0_FUKDA|nr:hypothetical protein H920_05636 [Fukomys damarensis]
MVDDGEELQMINSEQMKKKLLQWSRQPQKSPKSEEENEVQGTGGARCQEMHRPLHGGGLDWEVMQRDPCSLPRIHSSLRHQDVMLAAGEVTDDARTVTVQAGPAPV